MRPFTIQIVTSTFLLLLSLPVTVSFAQNAVVANTEEAPLSLYKEANEFLNNGDTEGAIDVYNQVIDFYTQEGRLTELSESYLGMALSFALSGNYDESIRFHKKALRAHRRYRSSEFPDAILMNLSLVYKLAGKERKSSRFMNKAS